MIDTNRFFFYRKKGSIRWSGAYKREPAGSANAKKAGKSRGSSLPPSRKGVPPPPQCTVDPDHLYENRVTDKEMYFVNEL